jgi:hypothetical protein
MVEEGVDCAPDMGGVWGEEVEGVVRADGIDLRTEMLNEV